jgi:hypothetical protein
MTRAFTDTRGLLEAPGDVIAGIGGQSPEGLNRIADPEVPEGYRAFIHEKDRKPIVLMNPELKPVARAFDGQTKRRWWTQPSPT